MPRCPECGRPLAITSPAFDGQRAMTAREFMGLPFVASSPARWVCVGHGVLGRVVVSVVDDRVEFVDVTSDDEAV